MDNHLEDIIDDLFDNENENKDKDKSEFKICKNNDNLSITICNMDVKEITKFSIDAITKILDLFPKSQRVNIVGLAKDNCKTENGLLFGDDC